MSKDIMPIAIVLAFVLAFIWMSPLAMAQDSPDVLTAKIKALQAEIQLSRARILSTRDRAQQGLLTSEDAKVILDNEGENLVQFQVRMNEYAARVKRGIEENQPLIDRAKKPDTM